MKSLRKERRYKADLLQRSFSWLALICWGLFLVAILAFHYARPEVEYGLLRYLGLDIRKTWELKMQLVFLYSLWGCFGITLISVVLNFSRNRRLEDYHIFYFAFLLFIAVVSLAAYYI